MNIKDVLEFIDTAHHAELVLIQHEATDRLAAISPSSEYTLNAKEKAMVIRGDTHLAVKSVRDRLSIAFDEAYDLVHAYRMSV